MKIVKLENGNVVITDESGNIEEVISGGCCVSLSLACQGTVVQIYVAGKYINIPVEEVTGTTVEPNVEVPFTGDAQDLIDLLSTDFFFELAGGLQFGYRQGSYQPFNYIFSGANSTLPLNTLRGGFITVFEDTEIDQMAVYPVIGAAGASVWGVYELDPVTYYPTNLLFQMSPVNNGSATVQFSAFTPPKKLKAGVYLAAGNTNSAATFQCHNGVSPMIHGGGVSAVDFNDYFQGWQVALAYSATLPATFPVGASIFSNQFVIKPAFRIA
jgi:hypothetical protein